MQINSHVADICCNTGLVLGVQSGGGLQGVVVAFRVVDGVLRKGDTVRLMNTKKEYQVDEIGVRAPTPIPVSHMPDQSKQCTRHCLSCNRADTAQP